MNPLLKPVILTSVAVVTNLAVYQTLVKTIQKIKPSLLEVVENEDNQKLFLQTIKVIGTVVALSIIASLAAGAVKDVTESAIWPDGVETEVI